MKTIKDAFTHIPYSPHPIFCFLLALLCRAVLSYAPRATAWRLGLRTLCRRLVTLFCKKEQTSRTIMRELAPPVQNPTKGHQKSAASPPTLHMGVSSLGEWVTNTQFQMEVAEYSLLKCRYRERDTGNMYEHKYQGIVVQLFLWFLRNAH